MDYRVSLCVRLELIIIPRKEEGVEVRIRAPMHSVDVRGRFGVGVVFSKWRGVSVGRIFALPTNPRSTRQLVIRGLLTAASRAWTALEDIERAGWEVYAAAQSRKNIFGQDSKASGFNEYVALSMLAADMGETPLSIAPIVPGPLLVTDGLIAEGAAAGSIDITWTAGQAGFVDAWITGVLPAGRAPKQGDYKHNSYTADATETVTIADLVEGGKYGVRIRQVFESGQPGPPTVTVLTAKVGA